MNSLVELNTYLKKFITQERQLLFHSVMESRTRYISVVLEDIYHSYNASAVLRTCDCFGIQDIHVIENGTNYQVNPDVALGSGQWITILKHNAHDNNTISAINQLKADGYRIIATTPHACDTNLNDFSIEKGKVALFFGTEMRGLSKIVMDNADEFLRIPMYGFTESFNISVSASIILYHLTNQLRNSELSWKFTNEEKNRVLFQWLQNSIKKVDLIIDDYCQKNSLDKNAIRAI